jgi:hypothetical protein
MPYKVYGTHEQSIIVRILKFNGIILNNGNKIVIFKLLHIEYLFISVYIWESSVNVPCKSCVEKRVTGYNLFEYLFLPMQCIDTFANTCSVAKHGLCPSLKKKLCFHADKKKMCLYAT